VDGLLDLLQTGRGEQVREMIQVLGKGLGEGGGRGPSGKRRIRPGRPQEWRNSDELFRQPGGTVWERKEGEMERRDGATYRHGGRSNWAGIDAY
jgi:hypothetical protein